MTKALIVPIHLDALYLQSDRLMVEAMAEFSRLPYLDRTLKREINAETASISGKIVSQPFQSQNLNLKAGVHLHWAMPDALTRGFHDGDGIRFPPLPNRWLVTRSRLGKESKKSWVVESDYVFPLPTETDPEKRERDVYVTRAQSNSISYFYRQLDPDSDEPFRYVGRQLLLDDWLKEAADERAPHFPLDKPLTTLGYGEIAFAAFYPNCHSVFGFHDGDPEMLPNPAGYQYEIIGWHSSASHDPIKRLLLGEAILSAFKIDASGRDQDQAGKNARKEGLLACLSSATKNQLSDIVDRLIKGDTVRSELREFLERQSAEFVGEGLSFFEEGPYKEFLEIAKLKDFNWAFSGELNGGVPEHALYYSSIDFPANEASQPGQQPDIGGEVKISVGNTTMEALSAYLAHELAEDFGIKPESKNYAKLMERLEDQLESLHLSGKLANRRLDIGPKFREARHNSGFTAFSGGKRWAVRVQSHTSEANEANAKTMQHASAAGAPAKRRVVLPPEMICQLGVLNRLQRQYDAAQRDIAGLRQQLFSDWYKYMLSAYHPADTIRGDDYPNVDEVKFFIQEKDIKPLKQKVEDAEQYAGKIQQAIEQLDKLITEYNLSSAKALPDDINNRARPIFERYTKAAARYWQPNEPVILMVGKGIRETERHGQDDRFGKDGSLECPIVDSIPEELNELIGGSITRGLRVSNAEHKARAIADSSFSHTIKEEFNGRSSQPISFKQWSGQPWYPLMLEWEVLLRPSRSKSNVEGVAYAPEVIKDNYQLPDNGVDLEVKEEGRQELAPGTVYSNRCFLTPHGGEQFLESIADYLNVFLDDLREKVHEFEEQKKNEALPAEIAINSYHEALKKWFDDDADETLKPVLGSTATFQLSRNLLKSLMEWYKKKPTYTGTEKKEQIDNLLPGQKADDPVYVVICAGLKLFDANGAPLTFLSQSLGGFNDELLMHKHTLQLPVADPLGFDEYEKFSAEEVAPLLAGSIHSAPEPTNQFNPIRTGAMSVTRLRLIDTFGQVKDFNGEAILAEGHEIITPQRLTVPDSPHLTWMPPRLVQPARVDFRWLPAAESDADATPICGWVLPNNLQRVLAVYDHRGHALGSVLQRSEKIHWEPAPGRNREVEEIQNPHLRKMVTHILGKRDAGDKGAAKNFLQDFLTTIESALETIDPEGHTQHQSLALLIGRPIAVVRASLDLQLQGAPAVHQGWHAFQQDLRRDTRETDNFTGVKFPVRIGEYQQLNDGVVGYWIEEKVDAADDGYRYKQDEGSEGTRGTYYAPQTPDNAANRSIDHPDIDIHQENEPVHILRSIGARPLTVTMLFDPRGKVHLTSGVLPTKVIDIPAEDYAEALEAIQVNFLTAPILTAHGTRSVAVPSESGFAWSWLEHERWLDKKVFAECFKAETDVLWKRLVDSGWIQPAKTDTDRARIVPMGRRDNEKLQVKDGELPEKRSELEDIIERLFWSEFSSTSVLERETFLERLQKLSGVTEEPPRRAVWDHLLEKEVHWLNANPSNPTRATVVPIDKRGTRKITPPSGWIAPRKLGEQTDDGALQQWVECILNTEALELSPMETQARFEAEQEIREGWLVLNNKREKT